MYEIRDIILIAFMRTSTVRIRVEWSTTQAFANPPPLWENDVKASGRSLPPVIAKLLTALLVLPLFLHMPCSGSESGRRVTFRHEPGELSCRVKLRSRLIDRLTTA
jgi:hypothetical protein